MVGLKNNANGVKITILIIDCRNKSCFEISTCAKIIPNIKIGILEIPHSNLQYTPTSPFPIIFKTSKAIVENNKDKKYDLNLKLFTNLIKKGKSQYKLIINERYQSADFWPVQ